MVIEDQRVQTPAPSKLFASIHKSAGIGNPVEVPDHYPRDDISNGSAHYHIDRA